MAGKAVVRWPSAALARISRFRPMSPASQVGLEAYRFESCRERFFVGVCVDRVRRTKCRYFIRFVKKKPFPTGFEPVSLKSHPWLAGWTHWPKARTSCQYRRWPLNHCFPGHFFDDFLNFLKRNGRDVIRSHTTRL